MCENLISAVQERSVLWDKSNKNYTNRLLSYREWEEVGKIIGTTSEVAKKKWKNLRDTFTKELKKIPKARSGADADSEPIYTGTWPYFDSMLFLKDIVMPRKTEGNIQPECSVSSKYSDVLDWKCATPEEEMDVRDTENTVESDAVNLTHESGTCVDLTNEPEMISEVEQSEEALLQISQGTEGTQKNSISSGSIKPTRATRYKRKQKEDGLHEFLQLEREKIKMLRQEQEENNDEDLLWFKSILPFMKQLPSLNKLHFRTQMQELLLKELSKLNTEVPTFDHSDVSKLQ